MVIIESEDFIVRGTICLFEWKADAMGIMVCSGICYGSRSFHISIQPMLKALLSLYVRGIDNDNTCPHVALC